MMRGMSIWRIYSFYTASKQEVLDAAKWACSILKNPDDLTLGAKTLPLSAINEATPEGKYALAITSEIPVDSKIPPCYLNLRKNKSLLRIAPKEVCLWQHS